MTSLDGDVDDRFAGIDIDSLLHKAEHRKRRSDRLSKPLYEAPEFIRRLNGEETVLEGQSLSLECRVVGFPAPTLRWFKDSDEIIDHPRISVEGDGTGLYCLSIINVNKGDEAAYRCRAENIEGCSSCVFFLSVKCKPRHKKRGKKSAKKRNVSFPPMFSTIVEKVEEEEKEGKNFETQPPSPLTEFYYALTLKGRQSWPSFVGDWAYTTGSSKEDEGSVDNDGEEKPDDDNCDDVFLVDDHEQQDNQPSGLTASRSELEEPMTIAGKGKEESLELIDACTDADVNQAHNLQLKQSPTNILPSNWLNYETSIPDQDDIPSLDESSENLDEEHSNLTEKDASGKNEVSDNGIENKLDKIKDQINDKMTQAVIENKFENNDSNKNQYRDSLLVDEVNKAGVHVSEKDNMLTENYGSAVKDKAISNRKSLLDGENLSSETVTSKNEIHGDRKFNELDKEIEQFTQVPSTESGGKRYSSRICLHQSGQTKKSEIDDMNRHEDVGSDNPLSPSIYLEDWELVGHPFSNFGFNDSQTSEELETLLKSDKSQRFERNEEPRNNDNHENISSSTPKGFEKTDFTSLNHHAGNSRNVTYMNTDENENANPALANLFSLLSVPSRDHRGRASLKARMPREKIEFVEGDIQGLRPPRASTPISFDDSESESSDGLESPTDPTPTFISERISSNHNQNLFKNIDAANHCSNTAASFVNQFGEKLSTNLTENVLKSIEGKSVSITPRTSFSEVYNQNPSSNLTENVYENINVAKSLTEPTGSNPDNYTKKFSRNLTEKSFENIKEATSSTSTLVNHLDEHNFLDESDEKQSNSYNGCNSDNDLINSDIIKNTNNLTEAGKACDLNSHFSTHTDVDNSSLPYIDDDRVANITTSIPNWDGQLSSYKDHIITTSHSADVKDGCHNKLSNIIENPNPEYELISNDYESTCNLYESIENDYESLGSDNESNISSDYTHNQNYKPSQICDLRQIASLSKHPDSNHSQPNSSSDSIRENEIQTNKSPPLTTLNSKEKSILKDSVSNSTSNTDKNRPKTLPAPFRTLKKVGAKIASCKTGRKLPREIASGSESPMKSNLIPDTENVPIDKASNSCKLTEDKNNLEYCAASNVKSKESQLNVKEMYANNSPNEDTLHCNNEVKKNKKMDSAKETKTFTDYLLNILPSNRSGKTDSSNKNKKSRLKKKTKKNSLDSDSTNYPNKRKSGAKQISPFGPYTLEGVCVLCVLTFVSLQTGIGITKFIFYVMACYYLFCVMRIFRILK